MSAEEAADMLASLAENVPEEAFGAPESPPPARASRRSCRVSVDVDSSSDEEPAQPGKRAKKTTGKPAKKTSKKPAATNKTKADLLAVIDSLRAELKLAVAAREDAEKAKKSSDVLVKGQKSKIKALENVIEGTETGELIGQLKAAKREVATANASTMQALTDKSIAEAKKDLLQKELKEKAKELSDATKEKNKLALKVGSLEGKLAEHQENTKKEIVKARGEQTRKNRTHASDLMTKRQKQSKQAQLQSRQESIRFLAQQNAQQAAMAQFALPNVGAGMPRRGFNELPLPFNNGQAANPIQYHQSLQMQQREWGNHAIGQFSTRAWDDDNDQQAEFLAWKAAQEADKKKKTKNQPVVDLMEEKDNDSELDHILQDANNHADEALELFDDDQLPASQGLNAISDNDADEE